MADGTPFFIENGVSMKKLLGKIAAVLLSAASAMAFAMIFVLPLRE